MMVLSAAERKRRREEEDAELYFSNLTRGEFYRLPERTRHEALQGFCQVSTTYLGYWKDCDLGKCRRAKRCVGFLTDAQYAASCLKAFPPCVRDTEQRRAATVGAFKNVFRSAKDLPPYHGPRPPPDLPDQPPEPWEG